MVVRLVFLRVRRHISRLRVPDHVLRLEGLEIPLPLPAFLRDQAQQLGHRLLVRGRPLPLAAFPVAQAAMRELDHSPRPPRALAPVAGGAVELLQIHTAAFLVQAEGLEVPAPDAIGELVEGLDRHAVAAGNVLGVG